MKNLSIIYDVTALCPWNCAICCMGATSDKSCKNNELTQKQKLDVVRYVRELKENGYDVRMDLSGGELFTDIPAHTELLTALSEVLGRDKLGVSCSGYRIDRKLADFLGKTVHDIEMTMDVVPYQPYKLRPAEYSVAAAKAVALLKKAGCVVGLQTVASTYNSNYVDALAVYAWACANSVDNWSILRFFPSGRGAAYPEAAMTDVQCEEYVRMVREMVDFIPVTHKPAVDFHYLMPGHKKYTNICRCVRHSIGILLLSLLTGVLECGWIAFGAAHSLPLWQILCYPLAYHIGNLFPKPFSLNRNILRVMCCLSAVTEALTFVPQLSGGAVSVLTCVTLFLLSAVIQSVRSGLKSDGNRLIKRVFRIGGFALAPLATVIPSMILVFSSVTALLALCKHESKPGVTRMTGQHGFSLVMIFHQLHYFFYAHITLAAMSLLFTHDCAPGFVYAALLFCGTWVTYMSVEPIVSKLTDRLLPMFFAGHFCVGVLLFVMHRVTSVPLFITLWLATGLGGGVVYTISARAKEQKCFDKDSMTIAENIGHTLGLLIAICMATGFDTASPKIMLVFASVSAFLAVISMTLIIGKEHRHENINCDS